MDLSNISDLIAHGQFLHRHVALALMSRDAGHKVSCFLLRAKIVS